MLLLNIFFKGGLMFHWLSHPTLIDDECPCKICIIKSMCKKKCKQINKLLYKSIESEI